VGEKDRVESRHCSFGKGRVSSITSWGHGRFYMYTTDVRGIHRLRFVEFCAGDGKDRFFVSI